MGFRDSPKFGCFKLFASSYRRFTCPSNMTAHTDNNVMPVPEVAQPAGHAPQSRPKLYLLDYGAGNVRR